MAHSLLEPRYYSGRCWMTGRWRNSPPPVRFHPHTPLAPSQTPSCRSYCTGSAALSIIQVSQIKVSQARMFIVRMQIIKLLVLYAVYTLIDHAYMHCLSNLRVKKIIWFHAIAFHYWFYERLTNFQILVAIKSYITTFDKNSHQS